jgi:hypothetical protein
MITSVAKFEAKIVSNYQVLDDPSNSQGETAMTIHGKIKCSRSSVEFTPSITPSTLCLFSKVSSKYFSFIRQFTPSITPSTF